MIVISEEEPIHIMRYLPVLFFFFYLAFGLAGLLFNLHWGFFLGILLAIFTTLVFVFFGEKLILVFAKARYVTDDENLIDQVKNFCCHCELQEVKVYWSYVFMNNIYYTDSYVGKPTLIIGKNIYNSFTKNELNSLIYASLLKLKSNEGKSRTMTSLVFFVLYSPVCFLRSLTNEKGIISFLNIFLYPFCYLKSKIYETREHVLNFDQLVSQLEGLKKDYVSALFKVGQLPAILENTVGGLLLNDLIHVKNKTDDVISYALIESVSIEERAKAIK